MGSNDGKVVSELVDEVRAAIVDHKVSSKAVKTNDPDY